MYKKLLSNNILNTETGAQFSNDSANRHYRDYLDWLDEGNTPEIEIETLEQIKAGKLAELNRLTDTLIRQLTTSYPASEIASWPEQVREATLIHDDDEENTSTPLLSKIAAQRGISVSVLKKKIIQKATIYSSASGYVFGERQRIEALIEAATTIDAVNAIAITITLPASTDE